MAITVFMPKDVELTSSNGNSNHLDNILSFNLLDLLWGTKLRPEFVSEHNIDRLMGGGIKNYQAVIGFTTPFVPRQHLFGREEPYATLFEQMFDTFGLHLVDRFGMYLLTEEERQAVFTELKDNFKALLSNGTYLQAMELRKPTDNTFYTSSEAYESFRKLFIEETDMMIKTMVNNAISKYLDMRDSGSEDDDDDSRPDPRAMLGRLLGR